MIYNIINKMKTMNDSNEKLTKLGINWVYIDFS